jgi:formyl-CoA transferase
MTVVGLSHALTSPHAAMMVADQGALVITVESPDGGDDSRGCAPPSVVGSDGEQCSTYVLSRNRNRESITLDQKCEDGAWTPTRLDRHNGLSTRWP